MTEFHILMLASFAVHGAIDNAASGLLGFEPAMLATVAGLVIVLIAAGWLAVTLGVRIGRSMERHAALPPVINAGLPKQTAAVSSPRSGAGAASAAADASLDTGMPLVPPELHREMIRDTLTGLWTREAILDQLRREMSRATRQGVPLGLVMVKLDHFDQMKKDYGETDSEVLLKRAAEHFVEGLREYDAAGRSGAEFLLVLPGWDPDSNPQRVDGMLAPIHMKPGNTGQENLQITASIGVASFHPSADSPYAEDLLQRADMAVHAAQAAGRNRAEFAPR